MTKPLSIAERVIVHTLLDAAGPVPTAALVAAAGIKPGSARSIISNARIAIAHTGALIRSSRCGARYTLEAPDPDALRAVIGPPVTRPRFMGFVDRYATVLRFIVEAAGRPVSLYQVTDSAYDRCGSKERQRAAGLIREIRADLEHAGSAMTIRVLGSAQEPLFAWRAVVDSADTAPADAPLEGITLPSVAGAYRYCAGRLMLDGAVVGRAA